MKTLKIEQPKITLDSSIKHNIQHPVLKSKLDKANAYMKHIKFDA